MNDCKKMETKRMKHFSRSPRWIKLIFVLPLFIMMHFAFAETADSGAAKNADLSAIKFDHSKTGFNLTGAHIMARCASCHVDGVFKGTPRDCSNCHVAGNRMGAQSKTSKHVATVAPCERCHQNTAWTPVIFNHVGLAPGSCLTCHNGTAATGKPSGHLTTTDSCDGCHKTTSWKQLTAGGTMPANHLPTTQSCSLCHNQSNFIPGAMNHAGIVAGCASCHSGQAFAGVSPLSIPVNHMPTSMPCETCHSMTNFTSFVIPAMSMSHAGIVTGCANCHNGNTFAGVTPVSKSSYPAHMSTTLDCSSCHTSTTTFLMANLTTPPLGHLPSTQTCSICHGTNFGPGSGVMAHTGITTGCANCHNGQVFTGVTPVSKPVNHLTTSAPCETCHLPSKTSVGGFAGTTMVHTGITGGCTNCHNGQTFAGIAPVAKPATHLPTSMACETCHSTSNFTIFAGTLMNHTGITVGCASCHSGATFAVGMTPVSKASFPTHQVTSSPCENCHTSTVSFLLTAGGAAMPTNHLPTTQVCSTCHSAASFYPGVMNHTGITTGCTNCHNGQAFAGVNPVSKPVNHLPTSLSCETCHSTTVFTIPGGFGATLMKHTGIAGGCTNCHNGQAFFGVTPVSKPTTHLPTSMSCETCHSTLNFTTFAIPATAMKHSGITSGCALCHSGTTFAVGMTPMSKPATHLATSAPCEGCHTSTASFAVASGGVMPSNHLPTTAACSVCHSSASFYPGVMNHTGAGIVSGCTTCHNGQVFAGVTPVSKPVNHVPTSLSCETCHSPTVFTIPGGFANGIMNHTGIVGGCTNCHNGQAFAGVTPVNKLSVTNHLPTTMSCETCHSSTQFTIPGGFGLASMNHTGIANGCATCHDIGKAFYGVTMITKLSTHFQTTLACETCHSASKTSTGGFAGTAMNHTGIVNNCTLCHNNQTFQGVAPVSKSPQHIPYATTLTGGSTMQCEFCHSTTAFASFMTGTVTSTTMHNNTQGGGACYTCHRSGGGWSATNMQTKTHNGTSATKDCSSSGCHRPIGGEGVMYTNWGG